MKRTITYGVLLACLLSITSLMGSRPNTVKILPWLIGLFYFPVVLYPAIIRIGRSRLGETLTLLEGFRIGLSISVYAAIVFGFSSLILSFYYLSTISFFMLVTAGLYAAGGTLLLGCLASYLCSVIIVKLRSAPQ